MRRTAGWLLLVAAWGCSNTVLVPVPPRMELKEYGTLGVTEFLRTTPCRQRTGDARAGARIAQPGTRLVELGSREVLLATIGGSSTRKH